MVDKLTTAELELLLKTAKKYQQGGYPYPCDTDIATTAPNKMPMRNGSAFYFDIEEVKGISKTPENHSAIMGSLAIFNALAALDQDDVLDAQNYMKILQNAMNHTANSAVFKKFDVRRLDGALASIEKPAGKRRIDAFDLLDKLAVTPIEELKEMMAELGIPTSSHAANASGTRNSARGLAAAITTGKTPV